MDHWFPLSFLAGATVAFSFLAFLLFRRWRTFNYLFLAGSAAAAGILSLVIFSVSFFGSGSVALRAFYFTLSGLMFLLLHAASMLFLRRYEIRKMYFHAAAAGIVLIGGIALFASLTAGLLIQLSGLAIFMVLSFVKDSQRRLLLVLACAFFAAGHLAIFADFYVQKILFVGLVLHTIAFLCLQFMFYVWIVGMLEAASFSAVVDGLTGCYTKNYFMKKVREAIQEGNAYALIFSDIDNFKQLNDTQGHQTGDEILKLVARTMRDVIEDAGIVGRYGGEEIVALITDPIADPGELAEAFRAKVEENSPAVFPVTVSVGYTIYEPGLSMDQFVHQADEAMYKAKKRGKNRVVSYQVF